MWSTRAVALGGLVSRGILEMMHDRSRPGTGHITAMLVEAIKRGTPTDPNWYSAVIQEAAASGRSEVEVLCEVVKPLVDAVERPSV